MSRRSCTTGYVWGVKTQEACPGATVVQGSKRAVYWADQLGIAFHEVLVEANSQTIGLVFSEGDSCRSPPAGYVPFIVAPRGHTGTYAEG